MATSLETEHSADVGTVAESLKILAGKYLTFRLESEEFAIGITKVKEIIVMQAVTKVPRTPEYIRGVINLRGKVIPVIDLRVKFGMRPIENSERTCIVVVNIENIKSSIMMGVVIDEVKEVLDIKSECIEQTPSFGTTIDTSFILGIGKVGLAVKMLLDIEKVLKTNEIDTVCELAN